ncbi:hypothetical protein [Actinacidiphila rubida]|uniref:hypothetical protein n=1 Tax=Actinacidiphila rubida TaxID=310780 RepID=UPI0011604FBE|nr:hypothetical protein [Actinacidiphila rubida]
MYLAPDPAPDDVLAPMPGVAWLADVERDPVGAMESFLLGWYPAPDPADDDGCWETGGGEPAEADAFAPGALPRALAALYRVARLRPAVHGFHDPLAGRPQRAAGPLGDRLVFAGTDEGTWDWSVPWPPEAAGGADPPVWLTFSPHRPDPEVVVEHEPLSRFLLQYVLFEAQHAAPYQAWTRVMPTTRLAPLRDVLRPLPLSPFLPMFTAERLFVAPGLLVQISADDEEAVFSAGTLHREALAPLGELPFPWTRFDG